MAEPEKFLNLKGKNIEKATGGEGACPISFLVLTSIFTDHHEKPFELGTGSYGTVIGFVSKTDKNAGVAVKKYLSPFHTEKKAQRCFRELQLLRSLNHENVVKWVSAYTEGSREAYTIYLVTEYAGPDLRQLLNLETKRADLLKNPKATLCTKANGLVDEHFSLNSFKRMIFELLRAIEYLSSLNILHRDVKPSNLAVNKAGKLTLLDFGMARVYEKRGQEVTSDSGTCLYRAIETIVMWDEGERGLISYDDKADIWSIGAVLCEMITGDVLFEVELKREGQIAPYPIDVVRKAIEICGPIPGNVISKIDNVSTQKSLREANEKGKNPGIDFIQYFRENGRPWLQAEIEADQKSLADFIQKTLAFDHNKRMSVQQALKHPFLDAVRVRKARAAARHPISDEPNRTVEEWQERIWKFINDKTKQPVV